MDKNACRDCHHLWQTHCGCSDHCSCGTGVECSARHGVSNLRSFPFKATLCQAVKAKNVNIQMEDQA